MRTLLALVTVLLSSPVLADRFEQALQEVALGRYSAAASAFHDLARDGDLAAAHNLAVLFALGHGVPQSHGDAAYWSWRAFLDGLEHAAPLAELMLAELNPQARAAVSDRLEEWLLRRAQDGEGPAMLALAVVQAILRPEPDLLSAHAWQSIAAALDQPGAVQAREETRKLMTPEMRSMAPEDGVKAFADWCDARGEPAPLTCTIVAR